MARSLDDAEFWLPSQFLTDDDVLMDKENFNKNGVNGTGFGQVTGLGFPTEFPYEFDSFCSNSALSSPVDSAGGLTETESSDEEDFLVGLTSRLAQSTLHETQKFALPGITHDKPEVYIQFYTKISLFFSVLFIIWKPEGSEAIFVHADDLVRVASVDAECNRELVWSEYDFKQWKPKRSFPGPVTTDDAIRS